MGPDGKHEWSVNEAGMVEPPELGGADIVAKYIYIHDTFFSV